MKQTTLLLTTLLAISICYAQTTGNNKVVTILQQVSTNLNNISKISYNYTHETRYFGDNYHYIRNATLYIEYGQNNPAGLRFQAADQKRIQVFNGTLIMDIDGDKMTIDTTPVKNISRLDNNSFLYHSLAMLRNVLPEVISNDSFARSLSDTVVNNKKLYCIRIEKTAAYFGTFRGTGTVTVADLKRPYYLLVDKKTFLPYQFIAKYIRGTDDRDFVTVTYNDIRTNPTTPGGNTWAYSNYTGKYQPLKPVPKKPLVKTGTIVADFTLPSYTPATTSDVSLHQFAGKVLLIDFWFKSCGYCMQAMPHYNALQAKFSNEQFQLITINIEDGIDDMKFFYNKFQPSYPMLFKGNKLFESLGFTGCPSSVLLDKNGKVIQTFAGFDPVAIEKQVNEVLTQK